MPRFQSQKPPKPPSQSCNDKAHEVTRAATLNDVVRGLERYQHLTPELRALTVNLIATELFRGKRARKERESGTPTGTLRSRRVTENLEGRQRAGTKRDVGGVDGTRTRGLRRDRPAF